MHESVVDGRLTVGVGCLSRLVC